MLGGWKELGAFLGLTSPTLLWYFLIGLYELKFFFAPFHFLNSRWRRTRDRGRKSLVWQRRLSQKWKFQEIFRNIFRFSSPLSNRLPDPSLAKYLRRLK